MTTYTGAIGGDESSLSGASHTANISIALTIADTASASHTLSPNGIYSGIYYDSGTATTVAVATARPLQSKIL